MYTFVLIVVYKEGFKKHTMLKLTSFLYQVWQYTVISHIHIIMPYIKKHEQDKIDHKYKITHPTDIAMILMRLLLALDRVEFGSVIDIVTNAGRSSQFTICSNPSGKYLTLKI